MAAVSPSIDPARIDVRGPIEVGPRCGARRQRGARGPGAARRRRAASGRNCVLRRSAIGARHACCTPTASCRMRRSARTAASARSRACGPARELADGVHLGNFVEIKNSADRRGSKVNHLSYVGDAEVGSRRQRRRRHHHLQLRRRQQMAHAHRRWGVHRLRLDARGAGDDRRRARRSAPARPSPRDAPAGKLTLARSRQVTIEQWQRPRKTAKSAT